jgi:hypothetical protein
MRFHSADAVEMPVAARRHLPGVGRAAQVAAVEHVEAMPFEDGPDVGDAQRLRAHARAAAAGTDVGGGTDQGDEAVHQMSTARSPVVVSGRS